MSQEKSVANSSRPGLLKLVERPLLVQEPEHSSVSTLTEPAPLFWSMTHASSPGAECFDPLFLRQVAKTPQAFAVVEGNERVTYQELDARVECLARHLQKAGAGPEVPIAVVAERGWKLLATVLAIFRTGSSYVPLDPQLPIARLGRLLEHSGSRILLTPAEGIALVQHAFEQQAIAYLPDVLCIEDLLVQEIVDAPRPTAATTAAQNRQAAYIVYTSGIDGEPKGIVVEQCGLVHWASTLVNELQLVEGDRVAQIAPVGSYLSIWQMLTPLLVGAQVEIFADVVTQNPLSLIQQVAEKQITILQLIPSALNALLEKLERIEAFLPELFALRSLLLTGEALSPDLCRRWFKLYPRIALLTDYGLAEGTGDVTLEKITVSPVDGVIPIGRPLPHTQVYILNDRCELASPGIIGEIYLGGMGVARGYLQKADATAATFVPDPFGRVEGGRLYKTGGQGRWREDGTLEYLGRLDRQIQIQGYRVELEEIEAQLLEHPAVQQCAVLLKDTMDRKQLVAYVVAWEEKKDVLNESALRMLLQQILPAYMVPNAFVFIECLPLLSDGKLDHQALLSLVPQASTTHATGARPSTPLEEVLAMIWSEVLGSEPAGIDADFFENGGHSLLALEFMARASDLFELALPLPWLFENPTIAGLATIMLEDESQHAHIDTIARSLVEVVNMSNDEVDLLLQDLN